MTTQIPAVLSKMQKELKVPKGQMNSFGGYKYRSCEDIVEAVKGVMPDGFYLLLTDEIVQIADRFYVKAMASVSNGTEAITTYAYARESLEKKGMDASQVTGATSSYARKYALNGLFGIDDTKDADTQDNTETASKSAYKPRGATKTANPYESALKAINDATTPDRLEELQTKISDHKTLTGDEKDKLMGALNGKLDTMIDINQEIQ